MSGRSATCSLIVLAILALVGAPAIAAGNDCGRSLPANVTIAELSTVNDLGEKIRGEEPVLRGWEVLLSDGTQLAAGARVPSGVEIVRGTLVNQGENSVRILFADGTEADVEPGGEVAIGGIECNCKCTCTDGDGNTETFIFPCDNNQDTCAYNGDECIWVEPAPSTTKHVGTYSDCKKRWVWVQ